LLVGAFFGLLFGYPQGVAQSATHPPVSQPGQEVPAVPQTTPQKNLIAESASTLGKVIAGFTLAKSGVLVDHFHHVCSAVAPALGRPDGGVVLAGAIILYFFATGFFSGLLLHPTCDKQRTGMFRQDLTTKQLIEDFKVHPEQQCIK
jgi:hypothetical protein